MKMPAATVPAADRAAVCNIEIQTSTVQHAPSSSVTTLRHTRLETLTDRTLTFCGQTNIKPDVLAHLFMMHNVKKAKLFV